MSGNIVEGTVWVGLILLGTAIGYFSRYPPSATSTRQCAAARTATLAAALGVGCSRAQVGLPGWLAERGIGWRWQKRPPVRRVTP